jgi:hypothetical protein
VQPNSRALRTPDSIAGTALAAFGVIAAGVTVIAVVESYSNLLAFALAYGLAGWRAAIAPGAVDSFVIMGELLLFAAILLHWGTSAHAFGAGMAIWGFLLSVGGNVWHAHAATVADRVVSAIWPVTATAGLAGALMIVRQAMMASKASEDAARFTISNLPVAGPLIPLADAAAARHAETSGAPVPPGGAGTQTSPPAPPSRGEPRRVVTPRAASRPGGLAAAKAAQDQELVARLIAAGGPLPKERPLSVAESITRPRAKKVLEQARAGLNGGSHG